MMSSVETFSGDALSITIRDSLLGIGSYECAFNYDKYTCYTYIYLQARIDIRFQLHKAITK